MINKVCIVTGSTGVLGTSLIRKLLLDNEIFVVAITSRKELLQTQYSECNRIKVIEYTSFKENTKEYIKELFDEYPIKATYINLGFPRTSEVEKLSLALWEHERIIKNLIDTNLVDKIINISSQSVYNQKSLMIKSEETRVSPNSAYGLSKYSFERIVELYCVPNKQKYANIRLASLFSLELPERLINRQVKKAINTGNITVDKGNIFMSYLDIEDAADGIIAIITSKNFNSGTYNMGNEDIMSTYEIGNSIAKKVKTFLNREVELSINDSENIHSNGISCFKMKEAFLWEAANSMEYMIEQCILKYIIDVGVHSENNSCR